MNARRGQGGKSAFVAQASPPCWRLFCIWSGLEGLCFVLAHLSNPGQIFYLKEDLVREKAESESRTQ